MHNLGARVSRSFEEIADGRIEGIAEGVAERARSTARLGYERTTVKIKVEESLPEISGASAREHSDEICLGQNTHELFALDDREAAYLALQQDARGLNQRRVGLGRDHLAAHHLFDQQIVEHLPLRTLAVAKRARQRTAKEISLAQDSGQPPVIFEYRKVADPSEAA